MRIKNLYKIILPVAIISLFAFANSCSKDEPFNDIKSSKRIEKNGKPEVPKDSLIDKKTDSTKYVIVLIIDGARYADTWEAAGTPLIPYRKTLSKLGCLSASFYNNGVTTTVPGHTAICTGVYQTINNGGAEIPDYPSFMQVWRKTFNEPANKAWIVASKDKLEVLSNCSNIKWKGKYRPMTDCGISGLNTGFRDDLTTLNKVQTILQTEEPSLMLINFKQPDAAGHAGDSLDYLQGIFDTDNYVNIIWNFIQNNDHYKNKTALIVTNDHGRHTAGHLDGFVSHGDDCAGCRHIEFLGLGPDFKQNYISTTAYSQIDIAPTIAYLLGFKMPNIHNGKVMKDLLKE